MKILKLSKGDMEYIQLLIEKDIIETTIDISFFKEMKVQPVDYINQLMSITKVFGMDFWEVVSRNCKESELKRLRGLYSGKPSGKLVRRRMSTSVIK